MTDVAGLVIGIVTTWKACVQLFEIVDSGRKYGMDYEIIRVKLEVERIRLMVWGDAVGLDGIEDDSTTTDLRLHREEVRGTVLRLLGCIQHIFENTEKLQESYGLKPENQQITQNWGSNEQSGQPQILGTVFKRAYAGLRRSARERQRFTPFKQKTIWAVNDKTKFQRMVTEIKGFNDNLASLFPDLKGKTSEVLRDDIDQSDEIRPLMLLQQAAALEHEEISETASTRLEALGATATARSMITDDVIPPIEDTGLPAETNDLDDENDPPEHETVGDGLQEKLNELERFIKAKEYGSLGCSIFGPYGHSPHVSSSLTWGGMDRDDLPFALISEDDLGILKMPHASFELYHRKKYVKKASYEKHKIRTSEDDTLLDPECEPKYENVNPGTVTAEGFAIECWAFEEFFGHRRDNTIFVSAAELPDVSASALLRRLAQLRHEDARFGYSLHQEIEELQEFVGKLSLYSGSRSEDSLLISDLYAILNRRDVFTDFMAKSSISLSWLGPAGESIGIWNVVWQIIVAKELAIRLAQFPDAAINGFTPRVLASLIVSDLWLKNVQIILTDRKLLESDLKETESPEERAKADEFKAKGNKALAAKKYQEAIDHYTEAIKRDLHSPIYRANRSAALLCINKFDEARVDAWAATELDPKYAKAWARLGAAELKLGNIYSANAAYRRAINTAGNEATELMKQGLAEAIEQDEIEHKKFSTGPRTPEKNRRRLELLDQQYDITFKNVEFHSHVHERQVEGLLRFAERMRWPFINEVRDVAEEVYGKLRGGDSVNMHLLDWIYGLTLPGKWMAFKIMTALIQCTPSISNHLGIGHYYECGLSLPKQSYWRVRTVLGRVLGCLPRVTSLCGWIGPCPAVQFDPPLTTGNQTRHARIKARHVAGVKSQEEEDGTTVYYSNRGRYDATRPKPDEDWPAYIAEMRDQSNWAIPEPPIRQLSTCSVQAIKLKKLPLDASVAAGRVGKDLNDGDVQAAEEYRASIVFSMDNNEGEVSYTLYTNPVFVTLPSCRVGPKGLHEVHSRELPTYQKMIWTVERLKDHTSDDSEDQEVMVINATGKGSEVLARAWCSERGKNALIRRQGGPCYVCAYRAAGMSGLDVGVLIWVS